MKISIHEIIKFSVLICLSLISFEMGCNLLNDSEPDLPIQKTNPPYWLTVESLSPTKIKISWVVWYSYPVIIQRSDSVHPFTNIASQINTNYFVDSTVQSYATYSYRLQGIRDVDTSYYSETISVKYLPTNKVIQNIQSRKGIGAATLSDNGDLIATVEDGIVVRNYSDLSTSKIIEDWYESWFPRVAIGFSGNASMITSGLITIKTFNSTTGSEILSINTDTSFIKKLFFIDSDKKIFGVFQTIKREGPYGWAILWDVKTGSTIQRFDSLFLVNPSAITISPNRKTILLGTQNKLIKYSIDTSIVYSILNQDTTFTSLCFSADGQYFVGSRWNQISFFNTTTGAKIRTIYGNYMAAYYLALSPNGSQILASSSLDNEVRIYNVINNSLERVINVSENSGGYISGIQYGKDGLSFVVTATDGKIIKYSTNEFLYSWQKIK